MESYNIKIGGLTYKVQLVDDSPMLNGEEVLGLIDYDRQEIYIAKDQHPELLIVTKLHEILHAIVHDRKLPVSNQEELIVDGFSRGLFQVLRDNPELIGILQKELDKLNQQC